MSPSLLKMWISLAGMGFMFFAIILIYFSRYKLKGFFKILTAIIAYILVILSGIIIFFVVFSGPTA
jgi:amino acid transporter